LGRFQNFKEDFDVILLQGSGNSFGFLKRKKEKIPANEEAKTINRLKESWLGPGFRVSVRVRVGFRVRVKGRGWEGLCRGWEALCL
jgi:hypothetical protein